MVYLPTAEEFKNAPSLHETYQHAVDLWRQVHPVWTGIGIAIGGFTTAFIKYRDVKSGLWKKHDEKVLHLLLEARRTAQVSMRPGQTVLYLPFSFQEIVKDAGRSEKSLRRTLRRLEDRGEVPPSERWMEPRPRPDALTLANMEHGLHALSLGCSYW